MGQHHPAGLLDDRDGALADDRAGIAIMLTAIALNVLGDGLRDALDPRGVVRVRGRRLAQPGVAGPEAAE